LPAVSRTAAGYRQYTGRDVHTLRFIKRARSLGFSMPKIAELLAQWHNKRRSSASVNCIAAAHVDDLAQRIAELAAMQRTLQKLWIAATGTSARIAQYWRSWGGMGSDRVTGATTESTWNP